jgi:signal transduction histidine kinase
MWQTLLRERRPFASYDVANDPRLMYRDIIVGLGATSNLVAPLLLGDEPIGFLSILNKHHRRYGPEEMELAQALAQQATLAVQLSRLAEQGREAAVLKERERLAREASEQLARANEALQAEVRERKRAEQVSRGQTQALARTLNTLTAQRDLDTFLGHLFQAVCEQLGADSVGVNLYDADHDRVVVHFASVGGQTLTSDDLREWGVAPWLPAAQETLWQAVLDEGCPFPVYDVAGDPRMVYRDQYLRSGAQSVLVVPLLLEDRPVGYICISSNSPHRYAPEETELAQALAQQATLAVQLESLATRGEEAAVLGERNRLAREIHDTLAQGFAGILIHLQLAEAALSRKPEKALPALVQARDLAKSSLAEARRSVLALRPNALENESLPGALRKLVETMTAGTPLRPRVEVRGAPCPLPADTENHLLRIGQEALNNVLKYAQASEASVTLTFGEGRVTLGVRDDGVGFTPGGTPREGGFGHVGMRERVQSLNGDLTILSAPGQGTEITVAVPIACDTGKV